MDHLKRFGRRAPPPAPAMLGTVEDPYATGSPWWSVPYGVAALAGVAVAGVGGLIYFLRRGTSSSENRRQNPFFKGPFRFDQEVQIRSEVFSHLTRAFGPPRSPNNDWAGDSWHVAGVRSPTFGKSLWIICEGHDLLLVERREDDIEEEIKILDSESVRNVDELISFAQQKAKTFSKARQSNPVGEDPYDRDQRLQKQLVAKLTKAFGRPHPPSADWIGEAWHVAGVNLGQEGRSLWIRWDPDTLMLLDRTDTEDGETVIEEVLDEEPQNIDRVVARAKIEAKRFSGNRRGNPVVIEHEEEDSGDRIEKELFETLRKAFGGPYPPSADWIGTTWKVAGPRLGHPGRSLWILWEPDRLDLLERIQPTDQEEDEGAETEVVEIEEMRPDQYREMVTRAKLEAKRFDR